MDTSTPTLPPDNMLDSSSTTANQARVSHPRRVFQTIAEAIRATPFFIDEETIGPWLSTTQPELLDTGPVLMSSRDAIHIPSLEKNGAAIDPVTIHRFRVKAAKIGLDHIRRATGYWTLSTSGELQSEKVLIAYSDQGVKYDLLRDLASEIIRHTNQDAVAIEVSGRVEQLRE